jgi:hypothetical protein
MKPSKTVALEGFFMPGFSNKNQPHTLKTKTRCDIIMIYLVGSDFFITFCYHKGFSGNVNNLKNHGIGCLLDAEMFSASSMICSKLA